LAYLSTQKSIKNHKTKKNSFKKPQTSIPTMAKKKERERKGGKDEGEKISKEFKGENWLPIL
jgi:hypothetical protein